jgi:hypothetical protein
LIGAGADAAELPAGEGSVGDSLAVPMFSDRSEALWPMQVGVEIVDSETGHLVVPRRDLVVVDGQHTTFAEVIPTPRGQRAFEIELVARHHAANAIELEYDVLVRQARFARLTWRDYLLHRLSLGPRPQLGPRMIAAARADIVETRQGLEAAAHSQPVVVDEDRYEIRLYAASLRG